MPHGISGIDLPHVVQGWDVLLGKADTGPRVALISQEDYYATPNIASFLAERGRHVEIFHKSSGVGSSIGQYSIGSVLSRLELHGVVTHPNLLLTRIHPDGLDFVSSLFSGKTYRMEGFDSVVLVYGAVAQAELYEQIKAEHCVSQLYLAGSAWLPRKMAEATQHGANIGLVI
jgi:hypothetical protein